MIPEMKRHKNIYIRLPDSVAVLVTALPLLVIDGTAVLFTKITLPFSQEVEAAGQRLSVIIIIHGNNSSEQRAHFLVFALGIWGFWSSGGTFIFPLNTGFRGGFKHF